MVQHNDMSVANLNVSEMK